MRMGRLATPSLIAVTLLAVALPGPPPRAQSAAGAQSASEGAPHAWLYGSWTGGLFPAPSSLTVQACLSQPVVIFTRDVVLRATITDQTYTQRVIETARTSPGETEFRFADDSAPAVTGSSLLGQTAAPASVGFGCESPNVLHVQRRGENEISFPNCADFPNPLVRCR